MSEEVNWIPEGTTHYRISLGVGVTKSIIIEFYNDHLESSPKGSRPISELRRDLNIEDCLTMIREKKPQPLPQPLPVAPARVKQPRYAVSGKDWIDEAFETLTKDEFFGAMKFTIGKYLRRIGKKDDVVQELEKVADYAERWKYCEQKRSATISIDEAV